MGENSPNLVTLDVFDFWLDHSLQSVMNNCISIAGRNPTVFFPNKTKRVPKNNACKESRNLDLMYSTYIYYYL
jgi:hypothetical protein